MSACNKHIFNLNPSDNWWLNTLDVDHTSFACRIGFVGDPINRSDQELTGKVLGQRRFEREFSDNLLANDQVKSLLQDSVYDHFPAATQYLVLAQLTGKEEALRTEQLKLAIEWLKSQKVNAIFFQYQWMLAEIKAVKDDLINPKILLAVP